MSRLIYLGHCIRVSRFAGGKDRGTCYQIKTLGGPAQLTRKEYLKMLSELLLKEFIHDE